MGSVADARDLNIILTVNRKHVDIFTLQKVNLLSIKLTDKWGSGKNQKSRKNIVVTRKLNPSKISFYQLKSRGKNKLKKREKLLESLMGRVILTLNIIVISTDGISDGESVVGDVIGLKFYFPLATSV